MAERKLHIDLARGFAIIWVVYGHAIYQLHGTSFFNDHLLIQSHFIYSFFAFRMPILFMISGSFQRKRLEYAFSSHKDYLSKILQSILLPFYSLSCVFLIINIIFSKYTHAPSLRDMIFSMLFQQSNRDMLPSGVLWFLFTLFGLSIITYISIKLLSIKPAHLLFFSLLLKVIGYKFFYSYHHFALNTISEFLFFYVLGYNFDGYVFSKPVHKWKYLGFIFLVLLLFILAMFSAEHLPPIINSISEFMISLGLLGLLGSLLVLGLSYILAQSLAHTPVLKAIMYCGVSSMLIYVFHMPTFTLIRIISNAVNLDAGYIRLFVVFLPGVLFPLILGKILSYNRTVYKILIGRNL